MVTKTVETADPQHYLRLLLIRLLETQQCLTPHINSPSVSFLKPQFMANAYTLSEIKSWLESQPQGILPQGQSPSSVPAAETSGVESPVGEGGQRPSPFAWRAPHRETATASQVLSSLPSNFIASSGAQISGGRIVFQPPSLPTKPSDT